jgi:hypothetical protein
MKLIKIDVFDKLNKKEALTYLSKIWCTGNA